jgi:hypothetical protein
MRRKPQRRASSLAPVYSLERSRTRRSLDSQQQERRVSSGPTGMYTEHIHWTHSIDKRTSKTRLPLGANGKQPSSAGGGGSGSYPILAWSE